MNFDFERRINMDCKCFLEIKMTSHFKERGHLEFAHIFNKKNHVFKKFSLEMFYTGHE